MAWEKDDLDREREKLREELRANRAVRDYQQSEGWQEQKAIVKWIAISLFIGMLGVAVLLFYDMVNLRRFSPNLIFLMVFLGQLGGALRGVWELANQKVLPAKVIKQFIFASLLGLGIGIVLDIGNQQNWVFHVILGLSWLGVMFLCIAGLRRFIRHTALNQTSTRLENQVVVVPHSEKYKIPKTPTTSLIPERDRDWRRPQTPRGMIRYGTLCLCITIPFLVLFLSQSLWLYLPGLNFFMLMFAVCSLLGYGIYCFGKGYYLKWKGMDMDRRIDDPNPY